jgi:hypothetical protein
MDKMLTTVEKAAKDARISANHPFSEFVLYARMLIENDDAVSVKTKCYPLSLSSAIKVLPLVKKDGKIEDVVALTELNLVPCINVTTMKCLKAHVKHEPEKFSQFMDQRLVHLGKLHLSTKELHNAEELGARLVAKKQQKRYKKLEEIFKRREEHRRAALVDKLILKKNLTS